MTGFVQAGDECDGSVVGQAAFNAYVVAMRNVIKRGAGQFDFAPYHAFQRIWCNAYYVAQFDNRDFLGF